MSSDVGPRVVGQDASSLMAPSLKIGAASGAIGFLLGGTTGILQNRTPIVFGISSSLQCAVLGSSFWLARGIILPLLATEPRAGDYTKASALAGAISGGLTGIVFRGPKTVLPRMLAMAALSAGGQLSANAWESRTVHNTSFLTRLTQNAWSPITTLSNDDYAAVLKERLLKLEVEIAIVDDKIAALQQEIDDTNRNSTSTEDQR